MSDTDRGNPNSPNDELAAFADGELDRQASERVVERISRDGQSAQRVLFHRQLKQAVRRVMSASAKEARPHYKKK